MGGKKYLISSAGAQLGNDDEKDQPKTDDDDGPDRRRHQRYRIGVLTEIESPRRGVIPGITFNISESGAMLLTLELLKEGEDVTLMFLTDDGRREVLAGHVVHDEELSHHMFWKHKIGVEFDEEVPQFLRAEFVHLKK